MYRPAVPVRFADRHPAASSGTIARAAGVSLPELPIFVGRAGPIGLERRPRAIVYTKDSIGLFRGTGSSIIHSGWLRWSSWTATSAAGTGEDWVDNCRPRCAAGAWLGYPVTLRAFDPERSGGWVVFTRVAVRYRRGRPSGRVRAVWRITVRDGWFEWETPQVHVRSFSLAQSP